MHSVRKTTILELHAHVVTPEFDGFSRKYDETDGGKVLGVADLIPEESFGRRGRWRITVKFEPIGWPRRNRTLLGRDAKTSRCL